MAFELTGVVAYLMGRIRAIPDIETMAPGGVHFQMARQGTRTPFVLVDFSGASDINSGGARVITDARFTVKVVSGGPVNAALANPSTSHDNAPLRDFALFDAIDAALDVQAEQFDLPVSDGQAPGSNGFVRITVRGDRIISYAEPTGDSGAKNVRYNHNGRVYRVTLRPGSDV